MVNLTVKKINYFVYKRDINIIECSNNITPFLSLFAMETKLSEEVGSHSLV